MTSDTSEYQLWTDADILERVGQQRWAMEQTCPSAGMLSLLLLPLFTILGVVYATDASPNTIAYLGLVVGPCLALAAWAMIRTTVFGNKIKMLDADRARTLLNEGALDHADWLTMAKLDKSDDLVLLSAEEMSELDNQVQTVGTGATRDTWAQWMGENAPLRRRDRRHLQQACGWLGSDHQAVFRRDKMAADAPVRLKTMDDEIILARPDEGDTLHTRIGSAHTP